MAWRKAIILVTLAALAPSAANARFLWFGKKKPLERIMVVPAPRAAFSGTRPAPPETGRTTCIDVSHVAGAQVFGDAAVELTLKSGARWRMHFAQGCPALDFYQGFYYRRAEQGRLCAGRDAVIVRTGGECAIASIVSVKKPAEPRRKARRHQH